MKYYENEIALQFLPLVSNTSHRSDDMLKIQNGNQLQICVSSVLEEKETQSYFIKVLQPETKSKTDTKQSVICLLLTCS